MRTVFLTLLALSAGLSLLQLSIRTYTQLTQPHRMQLHDLAAQFAGLQPLFAHIPLAGYYTDKDMALPLSIAQFEQAQYMLAPTVLELNNTSLPLVIFDCTTPETAVAKIKELGLVPLSASNTGIILAENPKGERL